MASSGTLASTKKGVRHIFSGGNEPDPFAPLTLTLSLKGRGQYWETLRQAQGDRNPMRGLDGGVGAISSRMASKTTLNCVSYFFSSSSSLLDKSLLEAINARNRTNARMISMFTCTARLLFKTLDSMATPCSVKA